MSDEALIEAFGPAFQEGRSASLSQAVSFESARHELLGRNERMAVLLEAAVAGHSFRVIRKDYPIGLEIAHGDEIALSANPGDEEGYVVFLNDLPLARQALSSDGFIHGSLAEIVPTVARYLGVLSTGARINPNYHAKGVEGGLMSRVTSQR
ncbi:hypothetical protein RFM98_02665 [Mesorhizobium sp. VK9D]|uniref:hypothetical protein n=1 Tax=Mesorhizobium australafricanum TaxID=3072311 RepID=UPI002A23F323|nr:hypothetical protein [Mesorhizobium sp. VK9D]MDX8451649.1 hypothetical protein [Mesorhizobium sp. VK9D]